MSFWRKFGEQLVINSLKKKFPQAAKGFEVYEKYLKPCIKAHKEYEALRKEGMPKDRAMKEAALSSGIPQSIFARYLNDKTGDFGHMIDGTSFDGG